MRVESPTPSAVSSQRNNAANQNVDAMSISNVSNSSETVNTGCCASLRHCFSRAWTWVKTHLFCCCTTSEQLDISDEIEMDAVSTHSHQSADNAEETGSVHSAEGADGTEDLDGLEGLEGAEAPAETQPSYDLESLQALYEEVTSLESKIDFIEMQRLFIANKLMNNEYDPHERNIAKELRQDLARELGELEAKRSLLEQQVKDVLDAFLGAAEPQPEPQPQPEPEPQPSTSTEPVVIFSTKL